MYDVIFDVKLTHW